MAKMRGIEAALKILIESQSNKGMFASEALRKLADRENMNAPDISLASSLIYIVMRRRELWEKIVGKFLRSREKLPVPVYTGMITGGGGLLELRRFSEGVLINGIVEYLKHDKASVKYVGLVNAVLRKILENGEELLTTYKKSYSLDERATFAGVPVWSLPAWSKTWNRAELNQLFDFMNQPSYSTLRTSENFEPGELHVTKSELSGALRLSESVLPVNLPGFNEGLCTVQSESSILAASLVKKFYRGKGLILDMCSGRGVKAGQVLQECNNARLECWELSEKRSKSAEHELERLHVRDRAILKPGNALNLEPDESEKISFIMLDAPCSGSGTWNRKPESKWRLDWQKFDSLVEMQKKLLERALTLCESGGYILYITCSLLRQENENVIAEVLTSHPEATEISSLIDWKGNEFKKGKPYGIYIWPSNPWLDGFYCSLIMKK